LEDEGYEVQAFNIPAAGVGAPHRRERIWIIATLGDPKYDGPLTDEIGGRNEEINGGTEKRQNNSFEFERTSGREDNENLSINVANANDEGLRTRIGGSDDDHAKESRSRGTDGRRSTSDDERHNTTSTTDGKMDVANTTSKGLERQFGSKLQGTRERFTHGSQTINRDVADTNSQRQQEQCRSKSVSKERDELERSSGEERSGWWEVEPNVGRVAHGVRGRVHRLKGLGNSIVPQIVEEIGKALIKGMK
jgi:DNA (cytosine-5)-methyltransferase 1